ncbi:Cancer-related nucleoside-triphosphatase, partial [Galemys pyrenaicus]
VGKTTLIQKASEVLKSSGLPVDGFYTEEVRQGGRRIGFDVVTLSGMRGPLSRVGSEPLPGKREYRVGQYVVDLTSFEQLALPVLRNAGSRSGPEYGVCVIDEIGKMELFSQPFIQAVRQTLSTPGTIVLGTIPIPKGKPLALVEEIRNRNDIKVFNTASAEQIPRSKLKPPVVSRPHSRGRDWKAPPPTSEVAVSATQWLTGCSSVFLLHSQSSLSAKAPNCQALCLRCAHLCLPTPCSRCPPSGTQVGLQGSIVNANGGMVEKPPNFDLPYSRHQNPLALEERSLCSSWRGIPPARSCSCS